MSVATPGQALRDALAALGWSVLPWASTTPAEREGLEGAARAAVAAAANGLLAAAGVSLDEVTTAVTAATGSAPSGQHDALAALTRVTESHERVMFAAAIDICRGDPGEARRLLAEQLDGWDGPEWDGTETGAQYLERTREAS